VKVLGARPLSARAPDYDTPQYGTTNSWKRVDFEATATSLSWHMHCFGQMEMDVTGNFAFDTPHHYFSPLSFVV
jgi:hypothetical protein